MVLCLQRKTLDAPLASCAVGHDLRVHNMFEERPHHCHLSAPVKRPKRKFSSSGPGLKVASQALKSWMFARSLFLPSHDFRTLSTFSPGFCYEGTTRKSRACIIPISMAAKCTKPIFELARLITLLPSMWYRKSFPIFQKLNICHLLIYMFKNPWNLDLTIWWVPPV